jgi:hypothetical protein
MHALNYPDHKFNVHLSDAALVDRQLSQSSRQPGRLLESAWISVRILSCVASLGSMGGFPQRPASHEVIDDRPDFSRKSQDGEHGSVGSI